MPRVECYRLVGNAEAWAPVIAPMEVGATAVVVVEGIDVVDGLDAVVDRRCAAVDGHLMAVIARTETPRQFSDRPVFLPRGWQAASDVEWGNSVFRRLAE